MNSVLVDRPKPAVAKIPATVTPVSNKTKSAASVPKAVAAPVTAPSKAPSKPAGKVTAAAAKKSQPNRREELLKQLKAVEEAIAKKRSKT